MDETRAIAEGLRRLHALDPVECLFGWTVEKRIGNALGQGIPLTRQLLTPPPVDQLVVCHGDACAPNTLVAADGSVAATVDLGAVGVGDRWADLAVATMSLGWNFDGELGSVFWETYGVVPDEERICYYRDLWNAT